MKVNIPFCGFYETGHDADLDDAAEGMTEAQRDKIDWRHVHGCYAKDYAERFLLAVEVPGVYVTMHSPREYNFLTDEIEVDVTSAEMAKAFDRAMKLGLADLVADEMKPRSGFIPFYSQDVKDWGSVVTWNAAQCRLVMQALAADSTTSGKWEHQDEIYLMEDARCNGQLEGWLYSSLPSSDPVTTVIDVNVRLTYSGGPVTREEVEALLLNALEHVRQESMLSDPEWRDDRACDYVELAKPQLVMDGTDGFSMDVQCSQPIEVVSISRDPHEIEEVTPVKFSELQGTLHYALCDWPGDKPEPAIVQHVDATVGPEVAQFFKALKEQ